MHNKDIGGQESLRSTWKTYYIDTKVYTVVTNVANFSY